MDTQKEKKHSAIGLATLSALLGITSKSAHTAAKKVASAAKLDNIGKVPLIVKDAKLIRNVTGVGAVGTGLASAILAAKYYKNKKAKVANNG